MKQTKCKEGNKKKCNRGSSISACVQWTTWFTLPVFQPVWGPLPLFVPCGQAWAQNFHQLLGNPPPALCLLPLLGSQFLFVAMIRRAGSSEILAETVSFIGSWATPHQTETLLEARLKGDVNVLMCALCVCMCVCEGKGVFSTFTDWGLMPQRPLTEFQCWISRRYHQQMSCLSLRQRQKSVSPTGCSFLLTDASGPVWQLTRTSRDSL